MTCLGRKSIPGPARPPLRDVENSFAEGGLGLLRGRQGLHPLKEFCQKLSTFQQNELCHYFQFFMLKVLTKMLPCSTGVQDSTVKVQTLEQCKLSAQ